MVPVVELRGAIPFGIAKGLDPLLLFPICFIGNMLPVPVIFFFARKVLEWGKDKPVIGGFFTFCLEKGHKGGEKLQEKAGRGLFLALLLFVGIPLPGTGAWTGSLVAALFHFKLKDACIAIFTGLILATVIMTFISYGIPYIISLFM